MPSLETSLSVPKYYSLLDSIHAWIYPDVQPVPEITWTNGFGRLFTIDGTVKVPILIEQKGSGKPLRISWHNESVSRNEVRAKILQILSLKLDLAAVFRRIKNDWALSRYYQRVVGIRPYLTDTVYEALVKAIIQQQISYRAANVITKRLIIDYDLHMQLEGYRLFQFPEPEDIVMRGERELRDLGLGFKVPYILGVTKMIVKGEFNLEDLRELDVDEIHATLQRIHGIGEWTVQALMISGLGIFTEFPYGDLGIRNVLGNLFNQGQRVSKQQVKAISNDWGSEGPMILYLLMCADVLGLLGDAGRLKMHKRQQECK